MATSGNATTSSHVPADQLPLCATLLGVATMVKDGLMLFELGLTAALLPVPLLGLPPGGYLHVQWAQHMQDCTLSQIGRLDCAGQVIM
jgi:hypothetical protein